MKTSLTLILLLNVSLLAASFDCTKAKTNVEKMICADPELSELDENLSKAFKETMKSSEDKEQLKREQFAWMKDRGQCHTRACVQNIYSSKIQMLTKNAQISRDDLEATSYLSLADKYAQQYDETKQIKKLIGADHYYKLYIHSSGNGTVEKRAQDFVNKYQSMLQNLIFPDQTVVDNGNFIEECQSVLEFANTYKQIKPEISHGFTFDKMQNETKYTSAKKTCPQLFPIGHILPLYPDYKEIYSIDINNNKSPKTIIRYNVKNSKNVVRFDYYIVNLNTCTKEHLASRNPGIGLEMEGFCNINNQTYYYEKDNDDYANNLSLPSLIMRITDTKFPVGYIDKLHKYSENGLRCSFTSLQKKYQDCWNYEYVDNQSIYTKECTNLYKNILLKDEK